MYETGLVQAKFTAPVKPIAGEAVIVTVPDAPGAIETAKGLGVRMSGLVTLSMSAALVDPAKFPLGV